MKRKKKAFNGSGGGDDYDDDGGSGSIAIQLREYLERLNLAEDSAGKFKGDEWMLSVDRINNLFIIIIIIDVVAVDIMGMILIIYYTYTTLHYTILQI